MQRTSDFVSSYNTEAVKYTGPLSIVSYVGDRNSENQMHGAGQVLFANGARYNGHFRNDMMHGYGEMTDPAGTSVYAGDFVDDMRHGHARFSYPGGVYEGSYAENKRHGQGKDTDSAGNVFEGEWRRGDFVHGKITYQNGDMYEGEVFDDDRHGQGKFIRASDGQVLEGGWVSDEFVGLKQ